MKKTSKILAFIFAGLVLASLPGNSRAADFTLDKASWSQIGAGGGPGEPSARRGHSAVYASSDTMIIFGGFEGPGYKNDVWKLVGGTWTEIGVAQDPDDGFPKTRADHSAVWTGSDMIIFGGWNHNVDDAVYRDVWILKNALTSPQWERKGVAPTPFNYGLRGSSAVWTTDSKMVIFGGLRDDARVYNRTMIYDPSGVGAWTTFDGVGHGDPVIEPRYQHSAVYDGDSSSMYIFGGRGAGHAQRNDMWKLNLSNNQWSNIIGNSAGSGPYDPPKPQKRANHSAFFDSGNNQMLIFGGMTPGGNLSNDVWALKMSDLSWKQVFPSGAIPGARSDQAGIYNGANDVIIFGGDKQGAGNHGDTWKLHFELPVIIPEDPPTEPPIIVDFGSFCVGQNTASVILYWTDHAGNGSDYEYYYTDAVGNRVGPISVDGSPLDNPLRPWLRLKVIPSDLTEGGIYRFEIKHIGDSHISSISPEIQLPMCIPTIKIAPDENMPVTDLGDGSYFAHTGIAPLKFLALFDPDGSDSSFSEGNVTRNNLTSWTENSDLFDVIQMGNDWDGTSYCTDAASLADFEKGCIRNNFNPHPTGVDGTADFRVTRDGLTDIATIEFDNQVPVATDFPITTNEDMSVSINMRDYNGDETLESYDPDTAHDDSSLTYNIVTDPTHGSLSGNGNTRTYAPNSNYNGPDTFTYKVTDLHGKESGVKTVSITVNSVNDTPIVEAGDDKSVVVSEDVEFSDASASDPDGDALTYLWSCTEGTLSSFTDPNPTYTASILTGDKTCTLTVNDGFGEVSDELTVTVTAAPNLLPTADARVSESGTPSTHPSTDIESVTINEGSNISLWGQDSTDTDGTIISRSWTCAGGTMTPSSLSTSSEENPTYTAPSVTTQTDYTCLLTVTDNGGAISVADTVTITVDDVPGAPNAPTVNLQGYSTSETETYSEGPISISYNEDVFLKWTVSDADSCTASNGWNGSKSKAGGTQTINNVKVDTIFTLSCTGPGGTTKDAFEARILTVTLSASPNAGPPPLDDVGLTATVSGVSSGTYRYFFDCNKDVVDDILDTGDIPTNPKTADGLCDYPSDGTYTAEVTVWHSEGIATQEETITVTTDPTLSVALSTSVIPPFEGSVDTKLVATVSGTGAGASGSIDYYFWWNCNSVSNDYDTVVDECGTLDGINGEAWQGRTEIIFSSSLHTYTTGSYTAKVIVNRSGLAAQDQESITVAADPCNPDTISPTPAPALYSPSDGFTGVGNSVRLIWDPSTDNCPGLTYNIYVGITNPPAFYANTAGTVDGNGRIYIDYSPVLDCDPKTYYWAVQAKDADNNVNPSSNPTPRSFITTFLSPHYTVDISPTNAYTVNPGDPPKDYNITAISRCGFVGNVPLNATSINPPTSNLSGMFTDTEALSTNITLVAGGSGSRTFRLGHSVPGPDNNNDRGTTFDVTITAGAPVMHVVHPKLYINKRPNAKFITAADSPLPGDTDDPPSGVNPLTVYIKDSASDGGGEISATGNSVIVFIADLDGNTSTIEKCYYVGDNAIGSACSAVWSGSGGDGTPGGRTPNPIVTPWTSIYNYDTTVTYGVFDDLALVTSDAWKSFSFSDNIPPGEIQPPVKSVTIVNAPPIATAGISRESMWFDEPSSINPDILNPDIIVPLGEEVIGRLAAWQGNQAAPSAQSSDLNGIDIPPIPKWIHDTLGMSGDISNGLSSKCEWDADFNGTADQTNNNPVNFESCSQSGGQSYVSFNHAFQTAGDDQEIQVARLTDRGSKTSDEWSIIILPGDPLFPVLPNLTGKIKIHAKPILTIDAQGSADGTVISTSNSAWGPVPSEIDCSTANYTPFSRECRALYTKGVIVTLTATPGPVGIDGGTPVLKKWIGNNAAMCTDAGGAPINPCAISMTQNIDLAAVFTKESLTISPAETILRIGQTFQFEAEFDPDGNCNECVEPPVVVTNHLGTSWTSINTSIPPGHNDEVVTFLAKGLVKAGYRGNAVVSASYNPGAGPVQSATNAKAKVVRYKWEER